MRIFVFFTLFIFLCLVYEMIYDKLFKMNRFSREFLLWYLKRKEGGEWKSETIRSLFKKHRKIEVGKNSYGWAHDYINGPLKIGNYVSIGRNFRRISKNHPIDGVTTHPCSFSPKFGWVKKDKRKRELLEIGNDVWIGDNVTILPGCNHIGDGSIIAAGAVLTKDVGTYEIWGGVPAKFIKDRFDRETAEALANTKWWDLEEDELKEYIKDLNNPQKFLKHFEK